METRSSVHSSGHRLSRRGFIKVGSAAVAAGTLSLSGRRALGEEEAASEEQSRTRNFRTLGRTGFKVSDVSMGCGRIQEANVVRNAYERGINYFDTAEIYGNGDSETKIGEAMQYLDREKIFITTKVDIELDETAENIIERFGKCLERMKTSYADALYMHGIADVRLIGHEGFHTAVERLKADGKLRYGGISSHGPVGEEPDSMEKVLCAAAEDGRFDVMLLSYNFMNKEEGEKVLAACKKHNIGTTGMKMAPGVLEVEPFDPENPNEVYAGYVERIMGQGASREEAVERIQNWVTGQEEAMVETRPFMEKHGIKTEDELGTKSVQWVLQNPDMHTVCVSMPDFTSLDKYIPLSGTKLSRSDRAFLRDYEYAFNQHYCRHGCTSCWSQCPERVPVSTIMRYSYYFARQGREKHAMTKYARLGARNGLNCLECGAPCQGACPHGVDVRGNLLKAHTLLSFA